MFQQTPRKPVLSRFALSRPKAKQGIALFIFALLAVTGVLTIFRPAPTSAAISSTLNFQARLETAGGAIVPDGNYNIEFKLYDLSSSTGSSQGSCTGDADCLWTETRTSGNQVKVINGYLTVNLGSVTSFPITINWNQQLWLTMRIGSTGTPSWDAEMSPRIQLTAVPYAFQAGALGNGSYQAVLDSSGNLVFQQASIVKELSATTGTALTIQGGQASGAGNAGGNLLLQGGAGGSGAASGSVVVQSNGSNSSTAFMIQNATGGSDGNLFLANTVNTNLVANSSFEADANGWSNNSVNTGSAPVSTTAQALYGNASLAINTSATAGAGAKYDTSTLLSPNTTYSFSFWAMIPSSTFTVQAGRSDTDVVGGETTCTLSSSTVSATWTRFTCSFTTGSSITTGGYVFIRQSGSTAKTWYVDGVQLEQSASPTAYHEGAIQINGLITGPVVFQNAQDTVQAWQVKNAAGTANVITVDTANIRLGVNTLSPTVALDVGGKANFSTAGQSPLFDSITGALAIGSQNATAINFGSTASNILTTINGTALVKPTTGNDSATAFQVQNAAGSSILTASTASLTSWTTNANSFTAVEQEASAISNGYAYVVAGTTTGAAAGGISTVQYAKVNSDGSVGTWGTTSALPAARSYGPQTAPVWNGYIYYAGGYNTSGTVQSTVYYAKLNADGTVGTWNSTTSLSVATAEGEMVAANGYLYWIGGYNGTADVATSYYAKINADGTVGTWTTTGIALPSNLSDFQAVVANGYIYTVGGWAGAADTNDIFSAKLNSNGTLTGTAGNWYTPSTVTGNSLPGTGLNDTSAAVVNGYLYVVAGAAGGGGPGTKVVYGFPLPADGSTALGTRVTMTGQLAANRWKGSAAAANGYIYYFGGDSGTGSTASGTVYYSSTTRISIAGDLDLVGLNTSSLSGQSSGGGAIYAGNIHSIGNLSVQGNTSLRNGLNVSGTTVIRDNASSTATFQVQNSSSANLFTVDTTNNAIVLGNDGTPSAITVRGGAATSSNTTGSNITFDASNGTGVGGSGDFIFRTASPASSTVTFDQSSSTNDGAAGAAHSFTWSTSAPAVSSGHTNYVLVVGVTITENAAQTIASVTYNGSALTKLNAQNCPGTTCRSELWYMVNPTHDGASHNVVVTLSGAQTANYEVGAASYYNVDQTTPLQTAVTSSGTAGFGGAATFTTTGISTTTTQVVLDTLASDQAVTNPGSQTVLWNTISVDAGVAGSKPGTGGTVNYSWTSGGGNWADVTTAINPAANTASDTLADRLHVTAAGNVGINTASPQHTLDVAGTENVTGALSLGTASSATGTLVFNNAGGANTITLQSGTTSASYTLTLPTAVGNSGDCLKASNGTGTLTWGACGGAGGGGVTLQASTPGTPDTGNFNISGTGIAATLYASTFDAASGVGLNIGNSNATSINVGKTGSNIATTINGTTLLRTTASDTTTAFQIQNASGNDNLLLANTVNTNLVTNSSAESNATNWTITTGTGTAPISTTSQALYGNASLQANTSATTNAGVKFNAGGTFLNTATTYSLSFWAKIASGSFTVQAGRSDNNTFAGETTCTLNTTSVTTTWTRFTCSFTTSGTVTSGGYIFIRQSDSTSRTWYIDGVQLEQASSSSVYHEGSLQFNGTVTGPTIFQNASDTTSAFQIQNAAGTGNLFVADTVNGRIGIGTASPDNPLNILTSVSNAGIHINGSSQQAWLLSNMTSGAFNNITTAGDEGLIYGGGSAGTANGFVIAPWLSGTAGIRLDGSGKVGVGVSSPSHTLDLQGGTLTVATNSTYALSVGNAVQGDFTIGSDGSNIYLQSWNSKPLEINNQGNNIYLVPSSGNVGIRTTSTSYPLDVNGVIRSSAGVIATGDDNGGSGGQLRMIGGSYGFFWRNDGSNLYLLQTASGSQYGTWTSNRQIIAPVNSDNIYLSNNGGNVGIGTTSTGHRLTVSTTASGGKVVGFDNFTGTDSSSTGILELRGGWTSGVAANSRYIQFYDSATSDTNGIGEGSVISRAGGVTYNNANADFGEYFDLYGPIQYGDIATGTWVNGKYVAQQATADATDVIGVMSYKTGFAGNGRYLADGSLDTNSRDTIGFLGQIATHVSDINGPIHAGDPIGLSNIPGYGVKAVTAGQIIGHAMEDFDPAAGSATSSCPVGSPSGTSCGTVQVLVNVSWYDPSTQMSGNLQGGNFANLNVTGDLSTYHLIVTSDATFKANIIVDGHVITGGDAPVADPQTATGTDSLGNVEGACTVNGNDTSGALTLVVGFNNLASGAQCTITFAKPFDSAPRPLVSATDKEAAGVGVYAQTSTTQMTIYFSQVPQAGRQYNFNYWNPQ